MNFQMIPLTEDLVTHVKQEMTDAHGNILQVTEAVSDRGVCRRCLHRFQPGEKRILFKHRPFQKESVFAEAGPIYVHQHNCKPSSQTLNEYPDEFRPLPLLLRAYDTEDRQKSAQLVLDGNAEKIIGEFLQDPAVAYIHLRDGEYGCYIARIERLKHSER